MFSIKKTKITFAWSSNQRLYIFGQGGAWSGDSDKTCNPSLLWSDDYISDVSDQWVHMTVQQYIDVNQCLKLSGSVLGDEKTIDWHIAGVAYN